MHGLLKLSLMLSILSVTGSALAQEESEFDTNACLWVNDNALFCVSPNVVWDPGIQIIVNNEVINGRHLEASWWPAPLDWYEVQLSAQCRGDRNGRFVEVISQWGLAPHLNCPEGTTMLDDPDLFKIRVRELTY